MDILEQHGVQAVVELDQSGTLVINLYTDRAIRVVVNDQPMGQAKVGEQINRTRPTFWTPDGKQTHAGTVDLRGEEH